MKIALYREGIGTGLGGSELCVAVLAEALSREHEVDLFHHNVLLDADSVLEMFGLRLGKANLRYLPPLKRDRGSSRKYRHEVREREKQLSAGYDLLVTFTHSVPPHCYARHGILHVLFPLEKWPWNTWGHGPGVRTIKERLARLVCRWRHAEVFRSYEQHTANSRYTRHWTQKRWGTECTVLYPPVLERFQPYPKINRIVTVGRFTPSKGQLHMVSAFRGLKELHQNGWSLACAGHLGTKQKEQDYFDKVETAAREAPCEIHVNLERPHIRELLGKAKLFWLATGFGEDDGRYPQRVEHFGIATIEAMSAGVVPLLIDKGSAREIIEHGVTGFLWRTLRELQEYSMILTRDDALRDKMAEAARRRAADFSLEHYLSAFGPGAEPRTTPSD